MQTRFKNEKELMLKKWRESNKSMKTFCEDEDVSYYSFQYWHRKLAKKNSAITSNKFIKVSPVFPSISGTNFCELHLVNGFRLVFPSRVEASYLKELF